MPLAWATLSPVALLLAAGASFKQLVANYFVRLAVLMSKAQHVFKTAQQMTTHFSAPHLSANKSVAHAASSCTLQLDVSLKIKQADWRAEHQTSYLMYTVSLCRPTPQNLQVRALQQVAHQHRAPKQANIQSCLVCAGHFHNTALPTQANSTPLLCQSHNTAFSVQANSTEAAGQGSAAGGSSAQGTQAGIAKPGDVSTERKAGSLTNQQVPKNLTAEDAAATGGHVIGISKTAVTNIAVGAATGGAAGGAVAAIGSLDDAMPQAKRGDLQQVQAVGSTVQKQVDAASDKVQKQVGAAGATLQNASDTLADASGLSAVKQEFERVLQEGSNISVSDGSMHSSGKTIMGSKQPQAVSRSWLDSAHMSQLFGVLGALLVFGLFMLRRRRSRPSVAQFESGLLGPGAHDHSLGGWLRPRQHRHRFAND